MADTHQKPANYHRTSLAVSAAVGHASVLAFVAAGVLAWIAVSLWLSFPKQRLLTTNLASTVAILLILLAIRHSQQMHMRSIHAKLDELIRAGEGGNHMIGSERLADEMLDGLRARHRQMANRHPD